MVDKFIKIINIGFSEAGELLIRTSTEMCMYSWKPIGATASIRQTRSSAELSSTQVRLLFSTNLQKTLAMIATVSHPPIATVNNSQTFTIHSASRSNRFSNDRTAIPSSK